MKNLRQYNNIYISFSKPLFLLIRSLHTRPKMAAKSYWRVVFLKYITKAHLYIINFNNSYHPFCLSLRYENLSIFFNHICSIKEIHIIWYSDVRYACTNLQCITCRAIVANLFFSPNSQWCHAKSIYQVFWLDILIYLTVSHFNYYNGVATRGYIDQRISTYILFRQHIRNS